MDFLASWITPEAGLIGLFLGSFLGSFLSATVLPGDAEALLFALVKLHPQQMLPALLLAPCLVWIALDKTARYGVVLLAAGIVPASG